MPDEYARVVRTDAGVGTGPREVERFMTESRGATALPVIPTHIVLLAGK